MVAQGRLWLYSLSDNELQEIASELDREIISVLPMPESFSNNKFNVLIQTIERDESLYGFWKVNLLTNKIENILEEPRGHLPWFEGGLTLGTQSGTNIIVYIAQAGDEPPSIRILNYETRETQIVELTNFPGKQRGSASILRVGSI